MTEEKDPTPVVATVNGEPEPTAVPEAEPGIAPLVPPPRKKTPSAENRELRSEVSELKDKTKWMNIGKAVGWIAMAATASYGAGRGDQAEEVTVVHEDSQARYAVLESHVKANAEGLKALAQGRDAALKQLSKDFAVEVQEIRIYMEGYLSALSRLPAQRRGAAAVEEVKQELKDKQAALEAERERNKLAAAEATAIFKSQQAKVKSNLPDFPKQVKSVQQLMDRKNLKDGDS